MSSEAPQIRGASQATSPTTAAVNVPQEVIQAVQAKANITIDTNNKLYEGRFGAIYAGTMKGQPVAVKLLSTSLLVPSKMYGANEAEEIVRLKVNGQPGLVKTVFKPFLVMKPDHWYVYPMELGRARLIDYLTRQKNEQKMPESLGKKLFGQIAAGLDFMHSNEMAHMKVSPWTIMIGDKNRVFLVGFLYTIRKQQRVPLTDIPIGTLRAYMSPDMVPMVPHPDKKFDPYKADVWALGYTMFQSLTGYSLWEADASTNDLVWKGHHRISQKISIWNKYTHPDNHPSDEAMKLLQDMLYYFEGARPTMKEVLKNSWWTSKQQ